MDNEMIVDFINSVEPDFSYGTSDGMSRAMVESAENIASINDYITESVYDTYDAYTESDDPDKPGFFGKLYNKVSTYFTIFMNIIKKFITKIKGFFMTIKRKLTVAFTKAIKAVGNFLRNRINNNKKKFDAVTKKDEVKIYEWNGNVLDKLRELKTITGARVAPTESYDKVTEYWDDVKETIKNVAVADEKKNLSLLKEKITTFDPNTTVKFLQDEYEINIDGKIKDVYNSIMKETNEIIKDLKKREEEIKKEFKKSSNKDSKTRETAKNKFKAINYAINQYTLVKYRVAQKIASACFKYYKKLFSAVRTVFGGINIIGTSADYKEPKDESAIIYDLVR